MKLKYQTLTKEEQIKYKKKFLKSQKSVLFIKANRILNVAMIGFILAIISFIYDIFYKTGTINYFMDIFLLIFTLIFIIVMRNIKLKELNQYVINIKKK